MEQEKIQEAYQQRNKELLQRPAIGQSAASKIDPKMIEKAQKDKQKAVKTGKIVTK